MAPDSLNTQNRMRILAISGSLRAASVNSAVLRAAAALAPSNVKIEICDRIGRLPHFNPDLDAAQPQAVLDFRAAIQAADGVLIACPEYAHGVPGTMKNALDWVVGSSEFVGKPVALINAAPRASMAQDALREILTVMSAYLIPEASLRLPLPNNRIDTAGILADAALCDALRGAIERFEDAIARAGATCKA